MKPIYETLRALWNASHGSGDTWKHGMDSRIFSPLKTENALVLADGLAVHGYTDLAKALTKMAIAYARFWNDPRGYEYATPPKGVAGMLKRVDLALYEIRTQPAIWSGQKRISAVIRYYHAISPSEKDVEGPFPASEADFVDLDAIRKWWKKIYTHRASLGSLRSWRKEKGKILLFPAGRSGYQRFHSIVIEPGRSKLSVQAREIASMAVRLEREGFLYPNMYARRLYRAGFNPERLKIVLSNEYGRPAGPESLAHRFNLRRLARDRSRDA